MNVGFLFAIILFSCPGAWAAVQLTVPATYIAELAYQCDLNIPATTTTAQDLQSAPDSWQLNSLSYLPATNGINLDDMDEGIIQASVPEPALTGVVVAALCGFLVIARKRNWIFNRPARL